MFIIKLHLDISGVPGIGKTASFLEVVKNLNSEVYIIKIACTFDKNFNSISFNLLI